jgi:hypothetical protein
LDDAAVARWFAETGGKRTIQEVRAFSRTVDSGSRGRLFERWLKDNVFEGRQRRMTIDMVDNPELFPSGQMRRTADFFDVEAVESAVVWDGKCYMNASAIDEEQLIDYAAMLDRPVFEKVGTSGSADVFEERRIRGVAYVFSERAAAEEARTTLAIEGAESWYIDDAGKLVNLF